MQYVEAHGARIPQIGFGTMTLKGDVCVQAVKTALQMGYSHLDTAWFYGNEKEVGEGMRQSGIKRDGHLPHHQGARQRTSSPTNSASRSTKASPSCNCPPSTCC